MVSHAVPQVFNYWLQVRLMHDGTIELAGRRLQTYVVEPQLALQAVPCCQASGEDERLPSAGRGLSRQDRSCSFLRITVCSSPLESRLARNRWSCLTVDRIGKVGICFVASGYPRFTPSWMISPGLKKRMTRLRSRGFKWSLQVCIPRLQSSSPSCLSSSIPGVAAGSRLLARTLAIDLFIGLSRFGIVCQQGGSRYPHPASRRLPPAQVSCRRPR